MVFDRYKNDECLDKTNVQGDFSVIGSEFINFITTVLTCRMLRKARESGVLNEISYGQLLNDLETAWRTTDDPKKPTRNDGYWLFKVINPVFEEMEALGLSVPDPKPEHRKPGRPEKNPEEEKPKRPRGRPRKLLS